jgi:MFS family permease
VATAAAALERISSRWSALSLVALTVASGAALRTVFSPMQELAKHDLKLSDLEVSFVQGLAASIPIAILSLPIGRMVDRGNRTRLLIGLAAVSIVGTLLTAFAQSFEVLFVARMLAGLGAVCAIPVAISIGADLSPVSGRGRALLLLSLGQSIGIAAAFALGGWLGGWLSAPGEARVAIAGLPPWREVHLYFGIAALALLLPLLLLREPERREVGGLVQPGLRVVLAELWSRRAFLAPLFIGQISVVMADVAAGIWAAPVLTRDFGLEPAQFAAAMGLAVLLPGIFGSIIGGVAADAGQRSGRRGGILAGAVVAAIVSIPAALFPTMPTVGGFATVLAVFLLCGAVTGLVTATTIAIHVPNELRGLCLGAFVVVSSVIGLGIAPTLVTVASSLLGGEAHLARALAGTGMLVSTVSAVAFLVAAARLPRGAVV